jgi:hypothetical protein
MTYRRLNINQIESADIGADYVMRGQVRIGGFLCFKAIFLYDEMNDDGRGIEITCNKYHKSKLMKASKEGLEATIYGTLNIQRESGYLFRYISLHESFVIPERE